MKTCIHLPSEEACLLSYYRTLDDAAGFVGALNALQAVRCDEFRSKLDYLQEDARGNAALMHAFLSQEGECEDEFARRRERVFADALQRGNPIAQYAEACRCDDGAGRVQDKRQAFAWYERSAAQQFAPAMTCLAICLFYGVVCETDRPRAVRLLTEAEALGDALATDYLNIPEVRAFVQSGEGA